MNEVNIHSLFIIYFVDTRLNCKYELYVKYCQHPIDNRN